jgi:RND family efflux transporter MFP subunit
MLATPGMPLLTIEDDRSYELEAAVEESRAGQIAIGQIASIEFDALKDLTIDGRVREITPSSDPATHTYTVKVQIMTPLTGQPLRSGFFGRMFFPVAARKALVIPESALVHRGQLEGVYIIPNNAALFRLIKTGKRYGRKVEVISGLAPGTRIVTAPTADISDGVNIIDVEASRGTP